MYNDNYEQLKPWLSKTTTDALNNSRCNSYVMMILLVIKVYQEYMDLYE